MPAILCKPICFHRAYPLQSGMTVSVYSAGVQFEIGERVQIFDTNRRPLGYFAICIAFLWEEKTYQGILPYTTPGTGRDPLPCYNSAEHMYQFQIE